MRISPFFGDKRRAGAYILDEEEKKNFPTLPNCALYSAALVRQAGVLTSEAAFTIVAQVRLLGFWQCHKDHEPNRALQLKLNILRRSASFQEDGARRSCLGFSSQSFGAQFPSSGQPVGKAGNRAVSPPHWLIPFDPTAYPRITSN